MEQFSIRWKNFRSLADTGWLRIRPITIVIGPNASGKTSLHAPLLLMKQTTDSPDTQLALKTKGDLFDAGSYRDLIHNHDIERNLEFSLRHNKYEGEIEEEELEELGTDQPGELNLEFSLPDVGSQPQLLRYLVRDIHSRELVHRYRLKSGGYSLRQPKLREASSEARSAIRRAPPEHFLFTVEPLFRIRLAPERDKAKQPSDLTFQAEEALYLYAISYVGNWIDHILSNISYIGPLRQRARRLYELSGEKPLDVGTRGENTPEILFRERRTELMETVNSWVSKFEFGFQIECTEVATGAYEIVLRRLKSSPAINLADTGFGLSQVLPLIVQGFYGEGRNLVVAEQPEIHLNPKLQSLLADLFVSISKSKKSVLVETHSEHLILRLRRLVAEGQIDPSDIALYYVEKHGEVSSIREVPFQEDGHIAAEKWPEGFFEDALSESLGLANAQYKRSSGDD